VPFVILLQLVVQKTLYLFCTYCDWLLPRWFLKWYEVTAVNSDGCVWLCDNKWNLHCKRT